jgi:hypothetical protein
LITHWLDLLDKGELAADNFIEKFEPILRSFAPMLDGLLGTFLPHLNPSHPVVAAVASLPPVPAAPTA